MLTSFRCPRLNRCCLVGHGCNEFPGACTGGWPEEWRAPDGIPGQGVATHSFASPPRLPYSAGTLRRRSYSALNSQPSRAMAATRYIHTSNAMLAPMLPYITL